MINLGRSKTHAERSKFLDDIEMLPNVALRKGEFARREGLRVILDHLGSPVKRELKTHVDVVL